MISAAKLLVLATLAGNGDVIVVTATGRESPLREQAGNTAVLPAEVVDGIAAVHPAELFTRVPGVWVTRGSNQEHLTAIRSPILTGSGACGAFLYLEDGLPVRPAGFCNVNQLIEMNLDAARTVEVTRGPGSALYGSNALHGTVNLVTRAPDDGTPDAWLLDLGPERFARVRATATIGATRIAASAARDDGWRDAAGQNQAKLNLRHDAGAFSAGFSGAWLSQDVAAYILGRDNYRDRTIARSNPTPDAFRDLDAQRAWMRWVHDIGTWRSSWRPYLRRSRMHFLQHYIPGQPEEENGHESYGLQWRLERSDDRSRLIVGTEVEGAAIDILQVQEAPLTDASPFLNETRPAGRHYDFSVAAATAAIFVHGERQLTDRLRINAGLRGEVVRYRYDNHMADGNLRDDGTACGFGGCNYNRPADRRDSFNIWSPKFGLVLDAGGANDLYLAVTRGHRAPQVHELYRLQRGQNVADLAAERMDAVELGWRGYAIGGRFDIAAFAMRKRAVVFQDANGFSVSDGRTTHRGIEYSWRQPLGQTWTLSIDGTFARHRYAFDRAIAGGETIVSGAVIPAAPARLASARLSWQPAPRHEVELEVAHTGAHWLDASNTHDYGGHTLVHLRGDHRLGDAWRLGWRVTNLADRRYAERADYAFGNYRYFPGPPRSLFITLGRNL